MDFLSLEQVRALSVTEASEYCNLLRAHIADSVMKSGGHLSSNLGVAEISMACVRVFDVPHDYLVYDVGHQSYIHKILTGRYIDENNLRSFGKYSGFTKRDESEFDPFGAGHSSTALSAAVGFAKASKIKGDDRVSVAVIGDGAFCTGMTFEAINNIDPDDRIVIILNDNEMSISKNVGRMSNYLLKIRSTKKYLKLKRQTKRAFLRIPVMGKPLSRFVGGIKDAIKHIVVKNTFFEELGIDYLGPADGNDLETVERLLTDAKNQARPVLVHLCTKKGKGFDLAEKDPDRYHSVSPLNSKSAKEKTFSDTFGEYILKLAETNPDVIAVTAAMCDGTGLNKFRTAYPDRFFDVGICEEHAVTFCAAMNAAGLSPYFAVYSTFFQRCYDQLVHDCALQNLKIIFALDRAGFSSHDGPTHHGVFDVSLLLSVPYIEIYSPATHEELVYSLEKARKSDISAAVRYPKGAQVQSIKDSFSPFKSVSLDENKKARVLFITYGNMTSEVIKSKAALEKFGIPCVIMKFLKLKPIDFSYVTDMIREISPDYLFVIEEGIRSTGFGEHLFSNLPSDINKTDIVAIDNMFVPFGTLSELYDYAGLSAEKITEKVVQWMKKN
jgi:1-deoxy-D-xylulose-5-phosphate synthase